MDDAQRLVDALKSYGGKSPNFGNAKEETEIEKILRNLKFSGGGGQNSGGMFGGGQLSFDVPIDSTSSFKPYIDVYANKPKNQPITGGVTGMGGYYQKRF